VGFCGRFFGALAGAALLAACSSTTNGSGQDAASRAPVTHDFSTAASGSVSASSAAPVTSGAPASAPASDIHPAPAAPLHTVSVSGTSGTTFQVKIWQERDDKTCFDHAYGTPMVTFLTEHPCRGLHRVLATTTVNGRPVALAESSTGFNGAGPNDPYKYTAQFKALEEADDTGSINDLLREGYRLPSGPSSVPSSEVFNVLGQDNGVVIYDVWYEDGPTSAKDPALIQLTEDVFLHF
jgi:hypothetical protein